MKMKYQKIKFPEDESAHNNIIEWWYFNGNLKDKKGNKYAFMDCLFKADATKVKIPFLKVPFKTVHFSHSLLSDIKNKKFYSEINPVSIISTDSFSKPLLFINYTQPSLEGYINYIIEKTGKFKYHIKTKNIDLILTSVKKPLLEGGKGFIDLNPDKTYYYSLTNLKTEGRIKIQDKWIDVKGKSWMDHQWADVPYNENKWTWFSIQLDNNIEIVCFEYDDRKTKSYLASISYPNDKHKHISKFELKSLGEKWKSKRTGTTYPLSWEIKIPSEKIKLKVEPLMKNPSQEIIFGTINYWEGPLKIKGFVNNKKVKGEGFMELVGYASDYSKTKILKNEVTNAIKKSLPYIQKGKTMIISNIKERIGSD